MPTTSNTITKLINIRINYDKSIKDLASLRTSMDNVKAAEKQLNAQYGQGLVTTQAYAQQTAALDQRMRSLRDEYRIVSKEIQNNIKIETNARGSLNQLRATLSNLTRQFDALSGAARKGAEGIRLMSQINKVTNEIKDAEKATQRFYRNVGNYTSALKGINEMTKGFRTLGGVITSALGGLSAGRFVTQMVTVAREFEDAMARVRAVSNPMEGEFDRLVAKARELGRTTRYTAGEVAAGMELLARNGLTAQQSLDAITPTLQLAQANVVSIADAAQVSTNVMNSFGKSTADLTRINDVLSSTCAHSATNLKDLAEAMKTAAPIAHTAQVPLEETSAALGVLANVGIRGSDAGTGIKQMLLALSNAYTLKKGSSVLQKYNLDINETTIKSEGLLATLKKMKEAGLGESLVDINKIVGKYAAPRVAALIQNVDKMVTLTNTLNNSLGENGRMFDQSLGTTSKAIYELKSAWESFEIDVYNSSSTYLITPIQSFTEALRFAGQQINAIGQLVTSLLMAFATAPMFKGILAPIVSEYSLLRAQDRAYAMQRAENIAASQVAVKEAVSAEEAAWQRYYALRDELDIKANDEKTARESLAFDKMATMTSEEISMKMDAYNKIALAKVSAENKANAELLAANEATQARIYAQNSAAITASVAQVGTMRAVGMAALSSLWSGVKAFFSGVKALLSTFAPMLILTAVFELAQGFINVAKNANSAKKAVDDLRGSILQAQSENRMVMQLEEIKRQLDEIHSKHVKTAKDKETEISLQNTVKGLLGDQIKNYSDINKAIDAQIAKLKQAAKVQAMQNAYTKQWEKLYDIAAKNGIGVFSSPQDLLHQLNDKIDDNTKTFGGALGNFFAPGMNAMFNVDNIYGDKRAVNDAIAVLDSLGMTSQMKADAFANQNTVTEVTPSGDFQTTEGYTPKSKTNGKGKNLHDQYVDLLTRYQNQLETLVADSVNGQLDREVAKAQAAYEKIKNTWTKDTSKDSPYGNIMSDTTGKISSEEKEKLKKAMSDVLVAAESDMDRKLREIEYKRYEQAYKLELESWNARIALAKDKSEEKYKLERGAATQQNLLDQTELEKRYMTGEFGDFALGARDTSSFGGEANRSLWNYMKERQNLDTLKDNGAMDNDEYETKRNELDLEYKAEAQYYNLRELLRLKFNQNEKESAEQHAKDLADIELGNMKNIYQEVQTNYQESINARMDHLLGLEGINNDYWQAVTDKLGAQQAIQLNLEYQTAQKEYQNAVDEKNRMIANGTETADKLIEVDNRINTARNQMATIHKETNDQMIAVDKARLGYMQDFNSSIISLINAISDEDKSAAKVAKAIALANIAIKTGVAMANVIEQAFAKEGAYGVFEAMGGVAEVLGLMAEAISTVKSAHFAKGGKVTGAGTGTSDSISAQLSNGEYVMTAKATKLFEPLLGVMNAIGAGVAIPQTGYITNNPSQMSDFQDAMTTAVAEVQPVVSVQEITRTQNRVKVIQNLDSINS